MATGVLDPIVGDPTEVSAAARTLQSIALDVAGISSRLRSLASGDWSGAAASSARLRSATLPPRLDKANASYAVAGGALVTYARALAEAQQQSQLAIANANRASDDLAAARAAQVAAAQRDAAAVAAAHASNMPPPLATAPRFEGAIEEAASRLARARALNEQAHELQTLAARTAGSALHHASHEGIHNASWFHHFTTAVGHWAATQWSHALRELSKIATVVSALAGIAALVLAVAGVLFPPLEAAAAVLETISLASAVIAGMADTVLAATGKSSWSAVGIDALTLAPAGLGKVVTKVAPMLRESRLITPKAVAHASTGAGRDLSEGARSELGVPGGLRLNDAAGGHVLRHVALNDRQLAARRLPEASTFHSRAVAERAMAGVQGSNTAEITTWLAKARPGAKALFATTFGESVGRILYRGELKSVEGSTAVAILRADPTSSAGYHIVTGYVAP